MSPLAKTYSKKSRAYYQLTKPGIIYGNLITAAAGFFLGSKGQINFWLLMATLLGTSFVIASASIVNNYFDRDIDGLMSRTKNRALVKGVVRVRSAVIYAAVLGLLGFFTLARYTNLLTVTVGLIGFVDYILLYGFFKRRSVYGTIIGSIAGATPIVAGYSASTNHLDAGALILFLLMVFWQMPHFYAIAIYRLDDYRAASIPVLPIKKGTYMTKTHMIFYIVAFTLAACSLTVFGYRGDVYLIAAALLGLVWLGLCLKGFTGEHEKIWARKMFKFSLILITLTCIMISLPLS